MWIRGSLPGSQAYGAHICRGRRVGPWLAWDLMGRTPCLCVSLRVRGVRESRGASPLSAAGPRSVLCMSEHGDLGPICLT